jgi:hypothetical protein
MRSILVLLAVILAGCKKEIEQVDTSNLKKDIDAFFHTDGNFEEHYKRLLEDHPLIPLLTVDIDMLSSADRGTVAKALDKIKSNRDASQFNKKEASIVKKLDEKQKKLLKKLRRKRNSLLPVIPKQYEMSILTMDPLFLTWEEVIVYSKALRQIEAELLGKEYRHMTNRPFK